MSEEEDPDLSSCNDRSNMRKDLEEACALWEDVGTEFKKLLAASVHNDSSFRELESKTERLLSVVKAMGEERQHTFKQPPEVLGTGLQPRAVTQVRNCSIIIPEKQYFKIGEISEMLDVEPYVLRYWESEFRILKPTRTRARQRLYHKKDVEKLELIKHLFCEEQISIPGIKKRLREINREKTKRVKGASAGGKAYKTLAEQQVTSDSVLAATDQQDYGKLLLEIKQMLKELKDRLES